MCWMPKRTLLAGRFCTDVSMESFRSYGGGLNTGILKVSARPLRSLGTASPLFAKGLLNRRDSNQSDNDVELTGKERQGAKHVSNKRLIKALLGGRTWKE